MLTPDDVTAVVVTRGDVDLAPVLDSLIFPNVIVYDNSKRQNQMTYARALAAFEADTEVVYSQDDDLIHTPENQHAILAAYEPGVLTGCMWEEWSDGARKQGIEDGYDDLVFPGSGSVCDRSVIRNAIDFYLSRYRLDDFFRLWCDTIVGVLVPTKQLDLRFDALPCADAENRMANMDDAVALKTKAIRRARWIRDNVHVRAVA